MRKPNFDETLKSLAEILHKATREDFEILKNAYDLIIYLQYEKQEMAKQHEKMLLILLDEIEKMGKELEQIKGER